jgi:signal peptidase I
MSDLPVDAGAERTSPLISFWLTPRQTIERIVADRPRYLVVPLVTLGGAVTAANLLTGYGVGSEIVGWRTLLSCVVGAAIFAVFNLYVLAVTTAWVGRKMGGVASNDAVRAVFAWGMLPNILGLAVVLSIAAGSRIFAPGADPTLLSSLFDLVYGVCGLWALVVTLLMLSRVERFGFWRTIVAYAVGTLVLAAGLALVVRTFLFQPFSLPAWSMAPTLLPGDYVFAAKYPYGYTRYSLPFSPPLFSGRIFGSDPVRGDVIVFRLPKDISTSYVKRVLGLPGDRIQMKDGALHINGAAVRRERMEDVEGSDLCGGGPAKVKRWRETLPEGASYETLDCIDRGFYDDTNVFTVPAGHLFVLGDNRDNSTDSRVPTAVGYIPLQNVIGRVGMIFFSRSEARDDASFVIRYERIGTVVQ